MPSWILIADRGGARLFASTGNTLELLQTFPHPEGRRQDHELGSDQPGRAFDSLGRARHANGSHHLPTENIANEYAQTLAAMVEKGRTDHLFDHLMLVADRKFLGRLRGALSVETTRLISATLDKDLSNVSEHELPRHLSQMLQAHSARS